MYYRVISEKSWRLHFGCELQVIRRVAHTTFYTQPKIDNRKVFILSMECRRRYLLFNFYCYLTSSADQLSQFDRIGSLFNQKVHNRFCNSVSIDKKFKMFSTQFKN